MPIHSPSELRVSKDRKSLTVRFPDTQQYRFTAEMLRVFSPSAEVQGHSPDQRQLISGKQNVEIMQIEPVGNYAIRITFDDMHNTGIFSWAWFEEYGEAMDERWAAYVSELSKNGLSR